MKQAWIYSPSVDGAFILAPALVITAIVLCCQHIIASFDTMPPYMWGILIIGVDVAHVYSTLYRTYADRQEFQARKILYTLAPFLCWVVGTLLYSMGALVFWRAITYLAVFHFMRQQYGFMMIYGRKEYAMPPVCKMIDKSVIYMATLYPLIYWHTHLPRQFDWFIEGDFIAIHSAALHWVVLAVYIALLAAYIIKEIAYRTMNIPKNLLLAGTAVSWWVGIVYFNNDLAFTAVNVIAHGIPYIALIWIYGNNQGEMTPRKTMLGAFSFRDFFSVRFIPLFIGSLILFAYLEEGLWDGFIWTEHKHLFSAFRFLPTVDDKATLAWLIPLLALPQATHYVLDAFIWRLKEKGTGWKEILFYREEAA